MFLCRDGRELVFSFHVSFYDLHIRLFKILRLLNYIIMRLLHKTFQDITVILEATSSAERGFGLSVKGGKDRREPVKVEGVILGKVWHI